MFTVQVHGRKGELDIPTKHIRFIGRGLTDAGGAFYTDIDMFVGLVYQNRP